ncbi:hypothetical protein C8T65DRAFT_741251 [Cerioporus squamosus]|nr:hypothetical protein C8T65DRAFT_741251 [Cerioporus squamosus]
MSPRDSLRSRPASERKVTRLGSCDSRYGARPSFLWIICPLLLVHPACGQNDTFNIVPSTNQPVQCGSYWFFWTGGTPPFEMQVGTIDNTQHIDTTEGLQGSSWLWEPVDLLSGTHLVLLLTDSTGRQTIDTSWAVVQPSDDDFVGQFFRRSHVYLEHPALHYHIFAHHNSELDAYSNGELESVILVLFGKCKFATTIIL